MMFLLSCIVSGYFFPIAFTFLPPSLNSKQIIGVLGIIAFLLKSIREHSFSMSGKIITAAIIASVFSIWCFFSALVNNTGDNTYATYLVSFSVWLGGAYGTVALVKKYHGYCNLTLLSNYLMFVGVVQVVSAQMIDNIPAFQNFVDSFMDIGQRKLKEIDRIYGIGCALDSGGIRLACILLLVGGQIANNIKVTAKTSMVALYLASFMIITVLGNMISRTTIVGAALGLLYMFIFLGVSRRGILNSRQVKFYVTLTVLLVIVITICTVLYNSDENFRHSMRFAFEGFFNLVEEGEFRTDSTDKLNGVMWIWPDNFRDWMIGTGWFGSWHFSTDVGYCRFILYCGIIGFSIFSYFFISNGLSVMTKFKDFKVLSLLLISMSFVIWIKVATDLFFVNALLFCIDGDYDEDGNEIDWNGSGEDGEEESGQSRYLRRQLANWQTGSHFLH